MNKAIHSDGQKMCYAFDLSTSLATQNWDTIYTPVCVHVTLMANLKKFIHVFYEADLFGTYRSGWI